MQLLNEDGTPDFFNGLLEHSISIQLNFVTKAGRFTVVPFDKNASLDFNFDAGIDSFSLLERQYRPVLQIRARQRL